jgi:hypothetical protein
VLSTAVPAGAAADEVAMLAVAVSMPLMSMGIGANIMGGGPIGMADMGASCWCCRLPSRLAMRATTGRLGIVSGVAPAVTAAAAAAAAVAAARASCWRVSSGGGVLWQLRTCW